MKRATLLQRVLILLSVLAVAGVFTLTGCGGGGGDSDAAATEEAATDAGGIAPLGNGKDIFNEPIKIAHVALSTAGITNVLIQKGINEQLVLYPNVEVSYFDAMYDINKQISLINECVTQGFDAILIEPLDTEALNLTIMEAESAGVPVITVNTGASGLHTLHMQGSDYKAGWRSAEEMVKLAGGEGTALVLDCPAEQKAIGLMGTGFEEYINQNTNIEILENQGIPNWSTENANTVMRDMLTKYSDITMVYCASDDIALGAVQAIEAAGRDNEGIIVWGNCGYRPALEAIKSGKMAGSMFSDVYVQYSSALYFALYFISTGTTAVTAGYTETPIVDQAMTPVTVENVDEIMAVSRWFVN
jgi:ABC-type sugar transport system substrate-binding protein